MDSIKDPTTGRLYKQEVVFCGKERCKKCAKGEGHGPYWYAYWWADGKTRKKYIGKTLPASLTQDNLHKTETHTQDSEKSYVRTKDALPKTPLPKTKDLHKTKDPTEETLHKTPKKALPKTDEGVVEKALEAIRSFHSRGIEPSVQEVGEAVGMESRPLGRLLKAVGMEAQNVRRDGVRARRYVFELKEKIDEIADEECALCKVPQDNAPFGRPKISEGACRPLIREKDDDVRQEAIRQIVKTPKEPRSDIGDR